MELSENQVDYLKEIINIGIGRSGNVLNKIVKNRVVLKVPVVQILKISDLDGRIGFSDNNLLSIVSMNFNGELAGKVELIFPSASAIKMVDLLTDKTSPILEMDQLRSGTLNEVGNIVLNSLIGTFGNLLKTRFKFSLPKFKECSVSEVSESYSSATDYIIFAETHFYVSDANIEGGFILYFELKSYDHFIQLLNNSMSI